MLVTLFASTGFVLVASLLIAFLTRVFMPRDSPIQEYLFGFNGTLLTAISNIGALLSLSVVGGGILMAVMGWGLTPIYGLLFGIVVGYGLFAWAVRRLDPSESTAGQAGTRTMLDLVDASTQSRFQAAQFALIACFLVIELGLMRVFVDVLFLDSTPAAFAAVFFASLLCGVYTSLGGYIGVLRTDLFQVLIVFGAIVNLSPRLFAVLPTAASVAVNPSVAQIASLPLLLAFALIAIALHFAMPDLWIRNVGAFDFYRRTGLASSPLVIGGGGLYLITLPFVALALMLLPSDVPLNGSVNLSNVMLRLRGLLFEDSAAAPLSDREIWWILGGFICISITTVNTWLIAIAQHWWALRPSTPREGIHVIPFIGAMVAFVASAFVDETNYLIVGLGGTLLMFGNVAILAAAGLRRRPVSSASVHLSWYYGTSTALTCFFVYWLNTELDRRIHEVVLWQAALASVLYVTLIVREVRA